MVHIVGTKGQVVIAKEIRDRLGIEPGWVALQWLVDDHVEIYFLPPAHRKSLKSSLSEYIKERVASGHQWDTVREAAWKKAAEERAHTGAPAP